MAKKEKDITTTTVTTEEENKNKLKSQIEEALQELSCSSEPSMFSYGLEERIFLGDLGDRILYIDDEIDESLLRRITMFIIKYNAEDAGLPYEQRTPIKLIINSGGGSVLDGIGLIDAITHSTTPVIGFAIGYAYSMAFHIFCACQVRVAMPNATFLYHDGTRGFYDSANKTRDLSDFLNLVDERLDKMLAKRTKMTTEMLKSIRRVENYWFADEGKEKGFVDHIIGEDVSFEDVFAIEDCECEDCCEDS